MKSDNEIRIDFQNALEQARRLDSIADRLDRRVAGKLEETTQGIHAAWKSDSASLYLGKNQELQRQIRQTGKRLRAAAEEIRKIARQIYEAEMRALEIARQRKT